MSTNFDKLLKVLKDMPQNSQCSSQEQQEIIHSIELSNSSLNDIKVNAPSVVLDKIIVSEAHVKRLTEAALYYQNTSYFQAIKLAELLANYSKLASEKSELASQFFDLKRQNQLQYNHFTDTIKKNNEDLDGFRKQLQEYSIKTNNIKQENELFNQKVRFLLNTHSECKSVSEESVHKQNGIITNLSQICYSQFVRVNEITSGSGNYFLSNQDLNEMSLIKQRDDNQKYLDEQKMINNEQFDLFQRRILEKDRYMQEMTSVVLQKNQELNMIKEQQIAAKSELLAMHQENDRLKAENTKQVQEREALLGKEKAVAQEEQNKLLILIKSGNTEIAALKDKLLKIIEQNKQLSIEKKVVENNLINSMQQQSSKMREKETVIENLQNKVARMQLLYNSKESPSIQKENERKVLEDNQQEKLLILQHKYDEIEVQLTIANQQIQGHVENRIQLEQQIEKLQSDNQILQKLQKAAEEKSRDITEIITENQSLKLKLDCYRHEEGCMDTVQANEPNKYCKILQTRNSSFQQPSNSNLNSLKAQRNLSISFDHIEDQLCQSFDSDIQNQKSQKSRPAMQCLSPLAQQIETKKHQFINQSCDNFSTFDPNNAQCAISSKNIAREKESAAYKIVRPLSQLQNNGAQSVERGQGSRFAGAFDRAQKKIREEKKK